MDELSLDGAHGGDRMKAASNEVTRMLAEETRRIQEDNSGETQLLQDEAILLDGREPAPAPKDGPAHMAPKDERADEDDEDLQAENDVDDLDEPVVTVAMPAPGGADPEDAVPQVMPVEATLLRPAAQQVEEEPLIVRNTRDYDHDAQSINVVAGNFDTIVDNTPDREVRRDPYARSSRRGSVPGEGNSRSKLRPLLAILIIAMVLGGGGAVLTYGMELWGGKSVPYLVGESQENAELRLAEKGLKAEVVAEPADDAIGKVLSQEPDSGVRVDEGGSVKLVVATNRSMPRVRGKSQEEAEQILRESGVEHIEIVTKPSSKAEGTVLRQNPRTGSAFTSRSTVTLTVATRYTVPDVVGKKETDAVDVIKHEGLNPEIVYVKSDKTVRTVVSTSPSAGEVIDEGGTVRVEVSSPYPTDVYHIADFFNHSSQDVDTYLLSKGFEFDKGGIDSLGNAIQTYKSSDKGGIIFSSQPYLGGLKLPSKGSSNVMSTGAPIAGVRLDCPTSIIPEGLKRSSVIRLGKSCGFKGLKETVTNENMAPPAGTAAIAVNFICGYGEMSDDRVWTVLIIESGSTRHAVATCAKRGMYSSSDLQPFGGSIARFTAYQNVYLQPEYQVKIEKRDDRKSGGQNERESEQTNESRSTEDAAAEAARNANGGHN